MKESQNRTIDSQISAMLRDPRSIFRIASVVPSMSRFDCVDVQNGDFLTRFRYHNAIVGCQINGEAVEIIHERPPNVNRQISLRDNASRGDCFIEIQFFFPKRDWTYLRQNWAGKLAEVNSKVDTNCEIRRRSLWVKIWSLNSPFMNRKALCRATPALFIA